MNEKEICKRIVIDLESFFVGGVKAPEVTVLMTRKAFAAVAKHCTGYDGIPCTPKTKLYNSPVRIIEGDKIEWYISNKHGEAE